MEVLGRGLRAARLRPSLICRRPRRTLRIQQISHGQSLAVTPVSAVRTDFDAIEVETFRDEAFVAEKPLVMQASPRFIAPVGPLPATKKWFEPIKGDKKRPVRKALTELVRSFSAQPFPYELEYPQYQPITGEVVGNFITSLKASAENSTSTLEAALGQYLETQLPRHERAENDMQKQLLRFYAPLALLDAANNSNIRRHDNPHSHIRKLYIAQAPLADLPQELQQDVPVPKIVKRAGKGDVYDSSVWLGLEPTYTPLHRDPNPNLFVQLCSTKVIRLLPPESGDEMYRVVQERLGLTQGNSRIRGVEMMQGPERDLLYKAIWWNDDFSGGLTPGSQYWLAMKAIEQALTAPRATMQEARLEPGDALFIPKGWWHSVKTLFSDGRLNGSVNWWFR